MVARRKKREREKKKKKKEERNRGEKWCGDSAGGKFEARGHKSKRFRQGDFESSALSVRRVRSVGTRGEGKKFDSSPVNGVSSGSASHSGNVRRVVTFECVPPNPRLRGCATTITTTITTTATITTTTTTTTTRRSGDSKQRDKRASVTAQMWCWVVLLSSVCAT